MTRTKINTLFSIHAVAVCCLLAAPASATTLVAPVSFDDATDVKIFTTEIKFDQDAGGARRGHDVFLRDGDTFSGPSFGQTWASGVSYDWSLAYDGDSASLTLGTQTITLDVTGDLDWDAVKIIARSNDTNRFDSATTTVVVDEVNGSSLTNALTYDAVLGQFNEFTRVAEAGEGLTSLSGTLTFDYQFKPGAGGSPNSRLAFLIKGLNTGADAIPEPAAALLTAMAAFAGVARRR